MHFAAIVEKDAVWLPEYVPHAGYMYRINLEDCFTPYGFALPTFRYLKVIDSINKEVGLAGQPPYVFLINKDKCLVSVLCLTTSCDCDSRKIPDTPIIIPFKKEEHEAYVATDLFATGHFTSVKEFLELHRSKYCTNLKYKKYMLDDLVGRMGDCLDPAAVKNHACSFKR